jgi:hypothetical protein
MPRKMKTRQNSGPYEALITSTFNFRTAGAAGGMLESRPPLPERCYEVLFKRGAANSPITAAKRRQNTAHGASRGVNSGNEQAPKGRKKSHGRDSGKTPEVHTQPGSRGAPESGQAKENTRDEFYCTYTFVRNMFLKEHFRESRPGCPQKVWPHPARRSLQTFVRSIPRRSFPTHVTRATKQAITSTVHASTGGYLPPNRDSAILA